MARADEGTATTSATTVTITGNDTDEICIDNTGGQRLRVRVPGVHGADFGFIPAGKAEYYGSNISISSFEVKTDSGSTTYTWEVTRGNA